MKKIKTTKKAIVEGTPSKYLKCCGYCDLSTLLRNHTPVAYTCGIYGWNFDVYDVYGLTICTGYRGMPGERLNQVAGYEKKAQKINAEYTRSYEERNEEIEQSLKEFCKINGGII